MLNYEKITAEEILDQEKYSDEQLREWHVFHNERKRREEAARAQEAKRFDDFFERKLAKYE